LIDYQEKNSIPLIDTLFKQIECKFTAKDTADSLYIHDNSLGYRLDIIFQLGYNLSNKNSFFDVYFALYLDKNF
jgi:sugar diacid utilization regulator